MIPAPFNFMKETKEQLKKKASALKRALRKTAVAAESMRLEHEAAAQEAHRLEESIEMERIEEGEAAAAIENIRQRTLMNEELEKKILEEEVPISLWQRFLASFR